MKLCDLPTKIKVEYKLILKLKKKLYMVFKLTLFKKNILDLWGNTISHLFSRSQIITYFGYFIQIKKLN